jgi:hypothetical protein
VNFGGGVCVDPDVHEETEMSSMLESLFGLIELVVAVACFIIGTSTRTIRIPFILTFGAFLIAVTYRAGNPLGLLVSPGGWLMMDIGLVFAVLVGVLGAFIIGKKERRADQ